MNAVPLARWRGLQTRSEPLLAILHVGYATIPLGFMAAGAATLVPHLIDGASATHVWAVGTFGVMTLAVMIRASLGHSNRPLATGRLEIAIFVLVLVGALARVLAPHAPGATERASWKPRRWPGRWPLPPAMVGCCSRARHPPDLQAAQRGALAGSELALDLLQAENGEPCQENTETGAAFRHRLDMVWLLICLRRDRADGAVMTGRAASQPVPRQNIIA